MNCKYFILLFLPFLLQAQEAEIKILSNNINTNGSEFNFIQVNDKTAFYSSATLEGDEYQSAIYKTTHNKGGFEFTLVYVWDIKQKEKIVQPKECPKYL